METFPPGYNIIGFRTKKDSESAVWIKFILGKAVFSKNSQTRQELIESRSYATDTDK